MSRSKGKMSRRSEELTLAARCFAFTLRAFPPRVSDRYGGEMLDAFVRERAQLVRTEGRIRALRFSAYACYDAARAGLEARGHRFSAASGEGNGRGPRPSRRPGPRRHRLARAGEQIADVAADARFALRSLLRSPAFTVVAVLSLAVGIGVNTSLATIIEEVWLKPVPGVTDQDRLVETVVTEGGAEMAFWSYPDFEDLRRAEAPFESLAAGAGAGVTLSIGEQSERASASYVSANFFDTLGVSLARGRGFAPSEDAGAGQHRVVVVSHDLWQQRLGGDDDVLGRTIAVNRTPYTVIGVTSEEFTGARPLSAAIELWLPLVQHPFAQDPDEFRNRAAGWLRVIGRTAEGTGLDEVNAGLQTVFASLQTEYPETNDDRSALARTFGRFPAQNRHGDMAAVAALLVMVVLILLIICGNVAGMVLARSAAREQEIAVRMALGSGRARLVRQLMVEASILAAAGGAVGTVFGFWVSSLATPERLGVAIADITFEPSTRVSVFSLGLTLAAAAVVGLLPALRFSRPQLLSSLKEDAGGGARRVGRIHRVAVAAQAAVALILLVTFSLFSRATDLVDGEGLGFEPEGLLLTRVHVSERVHETPDKAMLLLERLKTTVSAVPGVRSVAIADGIPLDRSGNFARVSDAGQPVEEGGGELVEFTRVDEDFFDAVGIPVIRGRAFEAGDDVAAERVVIITQDLADTLWPASEALGRRVRWPGTDDPDAAFTVVGVVGHVAASRATEDVPQIFVPLRQRFASFGRYGTWTMVVIRSAVDASAIVPAIQAAVLDADPTRSLPTIVTSASLVAESTEPQRATANISAGLGALALILCAIGVYGVVAFAVAHRTREIGVRMAMGASRRAILRAVFTEGVRVAVPGLICGGLVAAGLAALLRSQLFGLNPLDPLSFLAGASALLVVVLLASLVPARRAAGVDPMSALRNE